MVEKSETNKLLKGFMALVKNQFNKVIKILRTNNRFEFKSNEMIDFYREYGLLHQSSCVERKHRHILVVAQALKFQAKLHLDFWGECVLTAVHLINRTPNKLLQGKTPYEILFERKPTYDHLRILDCLCYA